MKPQTFMNDSGRVLANLRVRDPEKPVPDLLVLVDDFAIPAGSMRLRGTGSAGGHNGLKSVQSALGTPHYARLRLGVGPVPDGTSHHDFVLDPIPRGERRIIEELIPAACEAVECWMEEGIDRAMARFNRKAGADEMPA